MVVKMSDLFPVETYDANGVLISTVDNRDLPTLMQNMQDEVNDYRDMVIENGMYYMGHHWSSDAPSRQNMLGAISTILVGVALPSTFVWRDTDNIDVPFNSTQMITLGTLTAQWVQQVYTASWKFKGTVSNCVTLADFDALTSVPSLPWPTGNMDGTMANAIAAEQAMANSSGD